LREHSTACFVLLVFQVGSELKTTLYYVLYIVEALHDEKVWKHTERNDRKTRQISAITFGWTKEKWDVSWSLLVWI